MRRIKAAVPTLPILAITEVHCSASPRGSGPLHGPSWRGTGLVEEPQLPGPVLEGLPAASVGPRDDL